MNFLYHPDTVLTASDLETVAVGLLTELPLLGVEDCGFDSEIIWQIVDQAAVDNKSINGVIDSTRTTYSAFETSISILRLTESASTSTASDFQQTENDENKTKDERVTLYRFDIAP